MCLEGQDMRSGVRQSRRFTERRTGMKNVAFITYNSVGDDLSSGWHDGPSNRRALVLQNSRGEAWGAANPATYTYAPGEGDELIARRAAEIGGLWGQLQQALPE